MRSRCTSSSWTRARRCASPLARPWTGCSGRLRKWRKIRKAGTWLRICSVAKGKPWDRPIFNDCAANSRHWLQSRQVSLAYTAPLNIKTVLMVGTIFVTRPWWQGPEGQACRNPWIQYLVKEPESYLCRVASFPYYHKLGLECCTTLPMPIFSGETVVTLTYKPEAMFRIRPITRASSTLEGHSEAVLSVAFSPDGKQLASGSGDTTVRIWDLQTETPMFTCEGHKHWVLFVSFSPDCTKIASGGMDHNIMIWNAETGEQLGKPLKGHKNFITCMAWEPLVASFESRKLASSSKDQCVRIWDTFNQTCLRSLTSHTASVTKVLWGGEGLIYSSSQDRTIKVWHADEGMMTQELKGHGHWVNTLALSTDYVLRTGCFDHTKKEFADNKAMQKYAIERYEKVKDPQGERLVSGSDDLTMFLWQPKQGNKNIARMTGHQGLVNMVAFSPDSFYFVSASFDKSIKLWDGRTHILFH